MVNTSEERVKYDGVALNITRNRVHIIRKLQNRVCIMRSKLANCFSAKILIIRATSGSKTYSRIVRPKNVGSTTCFCCRRDLVSRDIRTVAVHERITVLIRPYYNPLQVKKPGEGGGHRPILPPPSKNYYWISYFKCGINVS